MTTPHELLMPFLDGELDPSQQEKFRAHLAECGECRSELAELMQLRVLELEARRGAKVVPIDQGRRRHWWPMLAAGALAAGISALVLRGSPQELASWSPGPARTIEPWVTWEPVSGHRPYEVDRAVAARRENIPLSQLAALESRGDFSALGTAQLVAGDPQRAVEALERAPVTAAQSSDLAAARLVQGELHLALSAADRAISLDPEHAPAHFNRGLVLERLGLARAASRAFETAATRAPSGWSEEARERSRALLARSADRDALAFAGKLATIPGEGEAPLAEEARRTPQQALELFSLAVLAAPDAESLERLSTAAAALDAAMPRAGAGRHLEYAKNTASRRFAVAPLFRLLAVTVARQYPEYSTLGSSAETIADFEAFIAEILRRGAPDQQQAALFYHRAVAEQPAAWRRATKDVELPFFGCAEGWASFSWDWLGGPTATQGLAALDDTIARCSEAGIERNVARAEAFRAQVWFFSRNLVEAEAAAERALATSRRLGDLRLEAQALEVLYNVARYRHDPSAIRAFGEELVELDPTPSEPGRDRVVSLHESLANAYLFALDLPAVEREMARAAARSSTLTIAGAFVLADLYRLDGNEAHLTLLERALDAQPEEQSADPPTQLLVRHIRALAGSRRDRSAALKELSQIVEDASALAGDATARSALAYSVSLLALEAGADGRFEDVFALITGEQQITAPDRCVLGAEAHLERRVIVIRDDQGRISGRAFDRPGTPIVPDDLQAALSACPQVVVVARPSLHGVSGLLAPKQAFSYAVGAPKKTAEARGPALYVTGVRPPAAARLPALSPLPEAVTRGAEVIDGDRATPSRVLAAMRRASWVEVHAHGGLGGESDAAAIALSPDADGKHLLLAEQVSRIELQGAPVVVLAACDAADVRREDQHLPSGLPVAFLRAGARAVLAADTPIPDAKAAPFFFDLRRRVEAGAAPAIALRDARVEWQKNTGESWVNSIVMFEPFGSTGGEGR